MILNKFSYIGIWRSLRQGVWTIVKHQEKDAGDQANGSTPTKEIKSPHDILPPMQGEGFG